MTSIDMFQRRFRLLPRTSVTVQIGAMDGVRFDPLHPVLGRQQAALLVEPLPHHFARLRDTYRSYAKVKLANVAVNAFDGRCTMYYIGETTGLPEWADGLGSLSEEVNALRQFGDRVRAIQVECVTWTTLLERFAMTAVDILLVDAEGFDDVIVESFPFQHFVPKLIMCEIQNLTDAKIQRLNVFLDRKGFERIACDLNSVWTAPDANGH